MASYSPQERTSTAYMPLPVIPELVFAYGTEEALMLSVLIEIVGAWQGQVSINEQRLYQRLKHLSRQQQDVILASLVSQDLVEILPEPSRQLQINLKLTTSGLQDSVAGRCSTQPSQVLETSPHNTYIQTNRYIAKKRSIFSGSRGRDDELSRIFAAKEAEIAQQFNISADWHPSENILQLLKQNMSIEPTFAMSLRDEFVVYYMDKSRKESLGGWDQKFLKWVKREQVQQHNNTNQSNLSHRQNEEARYTAKEKRRQITKAVLDISNTDW